jgi:hypothetical protein
MPTLIILIHPTYRAWEANPDTKLIPVENNKLRKIDTKQIKSLGF